MGRAKQKERERKRAAASCQRLDKLFSSKRNKTVESKSEILIMTRHIPRIIQMSAHLQVIAT